MIIHKILQGKDASIEVDNFTEDINLENKTWLEFNEVTPETLAIVAKKTSIPLEFLNSSLDEEESARIDNDSGAVLIVLDVPCYDNEANIYITNPLIIVYNDDYYVTINRYKTTLIQSFLSKTRSFNPAKHVRLTLMLIYQLSREFISDLKKVDEKNKVIVSEMKNTLKNKAIFDLVEISKTFVYFSTALTANKAVLSKLLKSQAYKKYEEDFDLMEDTEVELNQAIEMCTIYREILSSNLDSLSNVISNNLNTVMKALTIITIVIAVPTLITSIYGMNVDLPFQHDQNGFIIVISICVVLSILSALLLLYLTRNRGYKK